MSTQSSFGDKAARFTRFILLGLIAAVTALLLAAPKYGWDHPLRVSTAEGAGGVSAAPGYLALTMNTSANDKLYIVDTNKQVICVYTALGDNLRLVGARKFDFDRNIFDASIDVPGIGRGFGGDGLTRAQAQIYGERIQKMFDDATKR